MVVPSPITFQGGQMTDLPVYDAEYDPTALLELVSPGNVEEGVNYSITLALLSQFIITGLTLTTIVTEGATVSDPYVVSEEEQRILLNKTVASASYVDIGGGADRVTPVMVRDLKGDANTNNISVSFTGTCDGLSSPIVIDAPYGGWVFNPLESGNWYLTSA